METNISQPQEKVSAKYIFLHLFAIIMLYASVVAFLAIVFQYINLLIPDIVDSYKFYSDTYSKELMRSSIAGIIIVFPLLVWTSWFLNKKYLENPAISQMRIRKWLIYFTLFVAGLVIVGDLVRIIYSLLSGEMKTRFILKALSVLIVCGVIFRYYLWDLRDKFPFKRKYFVIPVSAAVLIAVVTGFFIIGSPTTERLKRIDQQKISDLQNIQSQIIIYWQGKQKLPDNLSALEDSISGFKIPTDTQNKKQYEYAKKGDTFFELCADFNLSGADTDTYGGPASMYAPPKGVENWQHEKGKACFDRVIDKDLYPPTKK